MATTFVQDAFPVGALGPIGTNVNLLDLLRQAYGDQVSRITSIRIGYWNAAYLASIKDENKNSVPFSYWDPANKQITSVLNNGVDIGGSSTSFMSTAVNSIDFNKIAIKIGNNIMPNVVIQIEWDKTVGNNAWQEMVLTTTPTAPATAQQQLLTHPFDGNTRWLDIVNAARSIASLAGGVPNVNDCHWIAMQIAALAGAPLDINTQMIVAGSSPIMQSPALNEDGGFWRVVYRGSQANPVDNWQTLVQPGDIVRMGWTAGGFHTLTVTSGLNADGLHPGQILVVDNTGPKNASGTATIAEHWVDYDGAVTDEKQVTIYRLTTDHQYLINGTEKNDDIIGTVLNDAISAGLGNDTVRSGAGDDVINGGEGADTLYGGAGNDLYQLFTRTGVNGTFVYDTVVEDPNQGTDTIWVRMGDPFSKSYTLGANIENGVINDPNAGGFTLIGNELGNQLFDDIGSNTLDGRGGNDTLNGGAGLDALIGGDGDDVYQLDDRSFGFYDDVRETSPTGGNDTVYITPIYDAFLTRYYQLTTNVENGVLRGSAAFDLFGNGGNNVLRGNTGANSLYGFDGNDILNGDDGSDTLYGGAGNDQYFLTDLTNNAFDVVVETATPGEDTVFINSNLRNATVTSYSLGAYVENGFIDGTAAFSLWGNSLNNLLVGNVGNDVLNGGAGDDTLNGGLGADSMFGGLGSDTYVRDNAGDYIFEVANGGPANIDLVLASVSTTLTNFVENLSLLGSDPIFGVGNNLSNAIIGNAGANALNGVGGNDTLTGGLGNDTFTFSSALSAAANVDLITDFANVAGNNDTIRLVSTVFTALKTAVPHYLTTADLAIGAGAAASTASQRILYDTTTGWLSYDADGAGVGAAVHFATIGNKATLTAGDFLIT